MLGKMVKFDWNGKATIGYTLAEDATDYCVIFENEYGFPMDSIIKEIKNVWIREIEKGIFKVKEPSVVTNNRCHLIWLGKSNAKSAIQNIE